MSSFAEMQWFKVIHCWSCAVAYAITSDLYKRRQSDGKAFWCPNGHSAVFKESLETKLKRELAQKEELLSSTRAHTEKVKGDLSRVTRAHKRMRVRVANGVCPCCNRSFTNLRNHMKTEHGDFGKDKTLSALRQAFGMTQIDVAKEVGVYPAQVSLFERDKRVPGYVERALSEWIEKVAETS